MFEKPFSTEAQEPPHQPDFKDIQAFSSFSSAQKLAKQRDLKHELYLAKDRDVYVEIERSFNVIKRQQGLDLGDDGLAPATYKQIPTPLIVRAPTMKDWSDSYHAPRSKAVTDRGENAVIEIASRIAGQSAQCQNIGELEGWLQAEVYRERLGVELKSILGPRGPIYLVHDGSHRIAAAKLLHLPHVWANASEPRDPQQAIDKWYDAVALMGPVARKDFQTVYDHVYPTVSKEQREEENRRLKQSIARVPEIRATEERYQTERRKRWDQAAIERQELLRHYQAAKSIYDRGVKKPREMYRLLNIVALERLKTNPTLSLWDEYKQEIDNSGCLIRKDGESSSLQASNYDDGDSPERNIIDAVDRYKQLYPDEFFGQI